MQDDSVENVYDSESTLPFTLKLQFVLCEPVVLQFASKGDPAMTIWPDMPDCGVYLVWPMDGYQWIHPDDAERASHWIPSTRVWRRSKYEDGYYRLHYGDQTIRVKPSMWHRVDDEGFSVGDKIEILGRFLENEPCIGRILEIRFHKPSGRLQYTIETRELVLPRPYFAEDLRQTDEKVQLRVSDFQVAIPPELNSSDAE